MIRYLLSDFVEALYGKYNALYNDNVPILSLSTEEIGEKMRGRMAYNDSGVSAVWSCGDAITLTTTNAAIIPITGINATQATHTESYAGQDISYFDMEANDALFIPGAPTSIPEQIGGLSVVVSDTQNVLTWNAVAIDTNGAPVQALFYRVYRDGILLADSLTATVYTDTSPIPGATYAVTALGNNCWKLESEDASATPTTLLDFTTSTLAETVTITWTTDVETNTFGFNLYRATTIDGPWTRLNAEVIPSKGGGVYTATDTGDEGQRLYYRIEEIETESTGSASLWYNPSHADIGIASTPYQITGLSMDVASDQNVLSWNETVSDTTGAALNALVYRVYTNTDAESTPSSSTLIAEVANPIFTHTTPITGVTYLVTAIGANEWRRESGAIRATPTHLLNFSAGVIAGAVTITWTTDVETHTQHFNLYISTPSTPTWTLIGTENTKGSGIYTISDPNDRRNGTFSYRLEEVEVAATGNAKLWYPSISVGIGPNAVSLMRLQAQSASAAIWVQLGGVLLVVGSVFGVKRRRRV